MRYFSLLAISGVSVDVSKTGRIDVQPFAHGVDVAAHMRVLLAGQLGNLPSGHGEASAQPRASALHSIHRRRMIPLNP